MPQELGLDQKSEDISSFTLKPSFEEILFLGAKSLGMKKMLQKQDLKTHRQRQGKKEVQTARLILRPRACYLNLAKLRPNKAVLPFVRRLRVSATVEIVMFLMEPFMDDLGRDQHGQ